MGIQSLMVEHLEVKDVVDVFRLFDLPEEGEVLHHELRGRLLAVQVQQVNHALTLSIRRGREKKCFRLCCGFGSGSSWIPISLALLEPDPSVI